MIKITLALAILLQYAIAQSPEYGQCGGIGWTGPTTCAAGTHCQYSNDYYSQCLPGTTTFTSTVATTNTNTKVTTTTTSTAAVSTVTGYVKTSGQKFTLNGATFIVVGENCYWLAQTSASADIDKAFADIAGMGATTVRTWGFNEVTSPSGTYYNLWNGATATLNTGATGLGKFDYVVSSAKAHGLRLIVTLTNNWSDYGGMDVYVKQILGSADHDYFYSNAQVIAAFKTYVKGFVGRYVNEPGIIGWELANEPRCAGSTGTTSGTCTSTTISTWVATMSAYIKSIDSNHLVGLGDEGFGMPQSTDYPYTYGIGTNFTADLAISSIDFGTFHLYPGSWGETADPVGWGNTWITNHAAVQKSLNKPVILEEFGVTSSQQTTYQSWLGTVVSSGLTGWLIWQAGSVLSTGSSSQDGYAIFPTDPTYGTLLTEANALKARG
ncbi:hypothetical protein FRB93_011152 [Tulasnella sp. JGI-2019a]|nr:hypothetical protein FRB93_011152 [Tulasnella sp. JGI-2019a]